MVTKTVPTITSIVVGHGTSHSEFDRKSMETVKDNFTSRWVDSVNLIMLDEIASKIMHKDKEGDRLR